MIKYLLWFSMVVLLGTCTVVGQNKTENLFLITVNGLQWNEVFTGADRTLLNRDRGGVKDTLGVWETFWRDSRLWRQVLLFNFYFSDNFNLVHNKHALMDAHYDIAGT